MLLLSRFLFCHARRVSFSSIAKHYRSCSCYLPFIRGIRLRIAWFSNPTSVWHSQPYQNNLLLILSSFINNNTYFSRFYSLYSWTIRIAVSAEFNKNPRRTWLTQKRINFSSISNGGILVCEFQKCLLRNQQFNCENDFHDGKSMRYHTLRQALLCGLRKREENRLRNSVGSGWFTARWSHDQWQHLIVAWYTHSRIQHSFFGCIFHSIH